MSKGLFFSQNSDENKTEFTSNDISIDEKILAMSVGETIRFPVSKKGSVTGRVSDLNKKFKYERIWHTRTMKIEFCILVIRDK